MGGGRSGRKRKRHVFAEQPPAHSNIGMGQTLQRSRQDALEPSLSKHKDEDSEEWETVMPKRQKKQNYPGLGYSEIHRLQNMVKLADLQALILYCLADGPSPQWVSIRHHKMVQKAVVLFVPGLEKGMFDGSIPLQESEQVAQPPAPNPNDNDAHAQEVSSSIPPDAEVPSFVANCAQSNRFEKPKPKNPDDYLPLSLDTSQLPDAVKSLADMFSHVWPIKAPGDDRLNQVHSPLQAVLQSPLPKSQEEKQVKEMWKGPKPAKESKDWVNQRTDIVNYVHKGKELLENEYVLHPACWQKAGLDVEAEEMRRLADKQTAADGWLNTRVEKLDDGMVPEKDTPKGSVTAGRQILAVDCEMCKVRGGDSALTRATILGWDGEVVMDEFVMPETPIIDYLTS